MIVNGKQVAYKLKGKTYHCAMDISLDYFGGKWKTILLWYMMDGTLRFTELKKLMPDITEKTLSIQLKNLETNGLIKRVSFGRKPPFRVEYSLTEFGKTLIPAIEAIAKWGKELGNKNGGLVEIEPVNNSV